ncbi:gibberellin 2-beta-dioxygenase 8-like [Silene latifolia]|uniref:gibberellin 2-beta-dioxygenase 8-like n=1 Tax=Silene latifolia TaxID=37657 RepID=UPI003D76C555
MDISLSRSEPPFEEVYKNLFLGLNNNPHQHDQVQTTAIESKDLPLVDLARLVGGSEEARESCKREIAKASKEWGFFQVVNHGIPSYILEEMTREQKKVFREPFKKKMSDNCMNMSLSPGTYRWGTPSAKCLTQLSWSEAFHIPLTDISSSKIHHVNNLSSTVTQFATTVSELADKLANILAENLGHKGSSFLKEICLPSTCYLRMNRYPPCPKYSDVFGLMPHTDSDFLTILYQDQVGGLQLVKDGRWIEVKPNPDALIVNIGDLLQAWSNGVYRSVEHRVVANPKVERLSVAYFLCPSYDAIIQSFNDAPLYKKFSFREYRQQVQADVSQLGYKIGLPRFLTCG